MNKKALIAIISVCIILVIGVLLIIQRNPMTKTNYDSILKKLDNKEDFVLLLIDKDSEMNEVFQYYIDVYDLDIEYLYNDKTNNQYNEIIKRLNLTESSDNEITLLKIKKGHFNNGEIGLFGEAAIKNFLIENELIDKSYAEIDTAIESDFKDYYQDEKSYCVLYINSSNEDLYIYRKELVKNKIRSLVLYVGNIEQMEAEKYFQEELGFDDSNDQLPAVIKVRQNKVLYASANVTVKDLVKKCK